MLTDNEIIKALEYCLEQGITSECERCRDKIGCRDTLLTNALDLINRQQAEIERLNNQERILICQLAEEREKAIKEFAERLKALFSQYADYDALCIYEVKDRIDIVEQELSEVMKDD